MKIQVIKKASSSKSTMMKTCPWLVEVPPEAVK